MSSVELLERSGQIGVRNMTPSGVPEPGRRKTVRKTETASDYYPLNCSKMPFFVITVPYISRGNYSQGGYFCDVQTTYS